MDDAMDLAIMHDDCKETLCERTRQAFYLFWK